MDSEMLLFDGPETGMVGVGEHLRITQKWSRESLAHDLLRMHASAKSAVASGITFFRIPFMSTQPLLAVVPKELYVRNEDGAFVSTESGSLFEPYALPNTLPNTLPNRHNVSTVDVETPFAVQTTSVPDRSHWCASVEEAITRIRRGELDKVVLARQVVIETSRPLQQSYVLGSLRRRFPAAYCFSFDGFIGASPELLISRDGNEVRSLPIAGTSPRSKDPQADFRNREELQRSKKNSVEHRHLSNMVHKTLAPFCEKLHVSAKPELLTLANVHHLASRVEGTLAQSTNVLELVAALHPTPAVGGTPTDVAIDLIAKLEPFDRGPYAGAIGWVDAFGNGEFAVAIRSAFVNGVTVTAFGGNGIVAESDPETEFAETEWKLNAILSALNLGDCFS